MMMMMMMMPTYLTTRLFFIVAAIAKAMEGSKRGGRNVYSWMRFADFNTKIRYRVMNRTVRQLSQRENPKQDCIQ